MESSSGQRLFWALLRLVGLRGNPAAILSDAHLFDLHESDDNPTVHPFHANYISSHQLEFHSDTNTIGHRFRLSRLLPSRFCKSTESVNTVNRQAILTAASLQGDTCNVVLKQFNYITKEQFFSWNPTLQGNCDGLWAGYWYCVADFPSGSLPMPPTVTAAPSPIQTSIASNCVAWYQMTGSDNCTSIATMFGTFSSADFIAWNPAVWSDCSNIQVSRHIETLSTAFSLVL